MRRTPSIGRDHGHHTRSAAGGFAKAEHAGDAADDVAASYPSVRKRRWIAHNNATFGRKLKAPVNSGMGRVVLIQIDENSVTLTPFGSLIRITPRAGTLTRVGGAKSWSARLWAVFALLFG